MYDADNVAYCGLYCGECIIRDERIAALSQSVLHIIDRPEFQKLQRGLPEVSPATFEYLKDVLVARRVLAAMCNLDCCAICKEGGGSSQCGIRICCQKKGLDGCWECEQMDTCSELAVIEPVHRRANIQNMKIIRAQGMDGFLAGPKHW